MATRRRTVGPLAEGVGTRHPVVLLAAVAVLAMVLGSCASAGSGQLGEEPEVAELAWITIPPQEEWNAAALDDVLVGEVDGCLVVGDLADPLYPIFTTDDPFPATLEVGDVVSLGGSMSSLVELGDIELTIPPGCEGVENVWFSSPQQ